MARSELSTATWKCLLIVMAVVSALLLVIEFTHAIKPLLMDGVEGSIGVTLNDQIGANRGGQGTYLLGIDRLDPESPLLQQGAQVGDKVKFDRFDDRWRKFGVGETVGLTLIQSGSARHITVIAYAVSIPFAEYFDYWGRLLLAVPALLFSLLIGFKQADGKHYRGLSMTFMVLSLMFTYSFNYSPASLTFTFTKLVNLTAYNLIWYCCAVFALNYQPYPQNRMRTWLTRALLPYRILACVTTAYMVWFGCGQEAPLLWLLTLLTACSGLLIVVLSLIDGWRSGIGEARQRHLWLLLSVAAGSIPAILTLIPSLDWTIRGVRVTVMSTFAGEIFMYCGLTYAVLKHRVFNFDFAISRAVIYSVISVLLLSSFGVIEWLSELLLHGADAEHGDGAQQSLVFDAGLALGVYLVFHQIHGRIERALEKLLFHKWHDNDHKLREFVRHAAHFTAVDPLLEALRIALDRFTAQAGCALYLRQPDGDYKLIVNSLTAAPATIDSNDNLAIALRSDQTYINIGDMKTAASGDLILPMSHRGTLNGFVILGSKSHGESYRPDECDVLSFAVQQIGLDLHALRVVALEHEVQQLAQLTEQQQLELQIMAGRRKNLRQSGLEGSTA